MCSACLGNRRWAFATLSAPDSARAAAASRLVAETGLCHGLRNRVPWGSVGPACWRARLVVIRASRVAGEHSVSDVAALEEPYNIAMQVDERRTAVGVPSHHVVGGSRQAHDANDRAPSTNRPRRSRLIANVRHSSHR